MPLPPLAVSERRLARFAAALSWSTALAGVACAFFPRLSLRALSLGGYAPLSLGERLFAAFAAAGFIGLAASLRRTARSPREQRTGFAPLLWLLATSAAVLGFAFRRGDTFGLSARPLGLVALACAVLYVALGFVYFRAAPGVNFGGSVAPEKKDDGPKAVQLGVRVAPAPVPLPDEPKAAAGASRG